MPMTAGQLEQMIRTALPDAKVDITDLRGDGANGKKQRALHQRVIEQMNKGGGEAGGAHRANADGHIAKLGNR